MEGGVSKKTREIYFLFFKKVSFLLLFRGKSLMSKFALKGVIEKGLFLALGHF